ncbi:phage antirepressor N-terminal domain-containing protein, partial [Undibacterium umbellatum]
MQTQIIPVPFYEDTLVMIGKDNEPVVAMKPIVDNMGLDWPTQYTKLTEKFSSTIGIIPMVAEDGKNRDMICLPLRKLPAWLYSISPNKVKPELKDKITRYQEECDDVLWEYWSKGAASRGDKVLDIPTLPPRDPVRPIGIRNKIDGLSARDTLILSNLKNDLIQKIAQNSEPAIRASLYIDLRRVSDALGVAVIDADHLPIPKP